MKRNFYFNRGERTILRDRPADCTYESLTHEYGADPRLANLSDFDKSATIQAAITEAESLILVEKEEIGMGGPRDLHTVNWLTFWALYDFIDGSTFDIEESLFWSSGSESSCKSKLNSLLRFRTEAGTL